MATAPLGFVAVLAGWTTTEAGRQPWVVYGHLRTADAVSPVSVHAVTFSLAAFFVIYNLLLLSFLWFAGRIAIRGPAGTGDAELGRIRPGLDHSGPRLLGAAEATRPYASPAP